MINKVISSEAIKRRNFWIEDIRNLSGHFGNDTEKLETELETEIDKNGISSLIDHLRLCGNIPESYGHDTSEEKLYSKYTDCLLSLSYKALVQRFASKAGDIYEEIRSRISKSPVVGGDS
jgi:type II restriction enzyme